MTYEEIVEAWNDQADDLNQWEALDEEEKVMWAYECGAQ